MPTNTRQLDAVIALLAARFPNTLAVALIIAAGLMISGEHQMSKAGRPLGRKEAIAIPYWFTYLCLLVLGGALMLAALVR